MFTVTLTGVMHEQLGKPSLTSDVVIAFRETVNAPAMQRLLYLCADLLDRVTARHPAHPSLPIPFRYRLGEFPVHFLKDRRKLAASENPMRSAT